MNVLELDGAVRVLPDGTWVFTAESDRIDYDDHLVNEADGVYYCSCRGCQRHHHCKHCDRRRFLEMTTDIAPTAGPRDLMVVDHSPPALLQERLEEMAQEMTLLQEFFRHVMRPSKSNSVDGDYGIIPGTKNYSLLQPGADKLCGFFGYAVVVKDEPREWFNEETGWLRVVTTIQLVHKRTGVVQAEGVGECNTREDRYAGRWGYERDIPAGVDKTKLRSRTRTGQNGQPYTQYRIPNEDQMTLWNTVRKMSKKRAYIDATTRATGISSIFVQPTATVTAWALPERAAAASLPVPEASEGDWRDVEDARPDPTEARRPDDPTPGTPLEMINRIVKAHGSAGALAANEWLTSHFPFVEEGGRRNYGKLSSSESQAVVIMLGRFLDKSATPDTVSPVYDEAGKFRCGACGVAMRDPQGSLLEGDKG